MYAGWLRAVRRGHARVHAGLDLDCPRAGADLGAVSRRPQEYDETCASTDIVLDVEQIRRWATSVGTHVTWSRSRARSTTSSSPARRPRPAFDELGPWLEA